MALWGNTGASTNAVKYAVLATSDKTGANMYQNVTSSAFLGNAAVGVFPVNANGAATGQVTAPGWVVATQHTGPVVSLAVANDGASYANLAVGKISAGSSNAYFSVTVNSIGHAQSVTLLSPGSGFLNANAVTFAYPANGIASFAIGGGTGYVNGEIVTVSNGGVNATASITTNATGGITSLTLSAPYFAGSGFANATAPVVTITTANGTNGNVTINAVAAGAGLVLTPTLGGRAGRIQYETLVAAHMNVTANSTLFNATL